MPTIQISYSAESRLAYLSKRLHTPATVLVSMSLLDFQLKYRDILDEESPKGVDCNDIEVQAGTRLPRNAEANGSDGLSDSEGAK